MRTKPARTPSGAIAVRQPDVNGWDVSYSPDDARWYVARRVRDGELEFVADFADRRNALAWARRHTDELLGELDDAGGEGV